MFTFDYRGTDVHKFNTCEEAIKTFNKKGYGMHNWNIIYKGDPITLKEFNHITDMERASK